MTVLLAVQFSVSFTNLTTMVTPSRQDPRIKSATFSSSASDRDRVSGPGAKASLQGELGGGEPRCDEEPQGAQGAQAPQDHQESAQAEGSL